MGETQDSEPSACAMLRGTVCQKAFGDGHRMWRSATAIAVADSNDPNYGSNDQV